MRWVWRAADRVEDIWSRRLARHALLWIVVLALVLRLVPVVVPSFHHADEVFQYLEPAHRLVTGYGLVTWEWHAGARGWLLPAVFSGPMFLSNWLWPGSLAYLPIIRGAMAIASVSVVLSFHSIGNGISRLHGLLAAFVAATWFELVYFASHTLSEPIALTLFMPAAALLYRAEQRTAKALASAGFLLVLATIVRIQYAPAFAVLVLLTCKLNIRRAWLPVVAGGIAALVLGALVDLSFGETPYAWAVKNFTENVVKGRSTDYGVEGPFFYPLNLVTEQWRSAAAVVPVFALLAVRHYPALFAVAVVNVLLHSLIGHKEYRFILLSLAIVVFFFSLGVADSVRYLGALMPAQRRALLSIGAVAWLALFSFTLAISKPFRHEWGQYRAELRAMEAVNASEDVCGVALFGMYFAQSGGYTYLNRPVPMYLFQHWREAPKLSAASGSFNRIVAPREAASVLPREYVRGACFEPAEETPGDESDMLLVEAHPGSRCVYGRAGTCTPAPSDINQTLIDMERQAAIEDQRHPAP